MKYTSDEVNELLEILNEIVFWKTGWETIVTNDKDSEVLKRLDGYQVKCKTDGDHKNDGQMVEYTFTLKSPKGKKTTIVTEMCLMVGWNFHKDIEIN